MRTAEIYERRHVKTPIRHVLAVSQGIGSIARRLPEEA